MGGGYFSNAEAFDGFSKFSLRFFSLAWGAICVSDALQHLAARDASKEHDVPRQACSSQTNDALPTSSVPGTQPHQSTDVCDTCTVPPSPIGSLVPPLPTRDATVQ